MKLLFDYLPLILFFSVFKWAGANPEVAHAFAQAHFSGLVAGGQVAATQAPILLATLSTMLVTFVQIVFLKLRRQKIDGMLWFTAAIVAVFGSATIYFNNETFILWKPTVLYWGAALSLLTTQLFWGKNLTRMAVDKLFDAPEALWNRLNYAWIGFFAFLGFLNLWVAFNFTLDQWVTFKLFGVTGLTLVMFIAQMVPLFKYMKETD